MFSLFFTFVTLWDSLKQHHYDSKMVGTSVDYEIVERLTHILNSSGHQMNGKDIQNSILAMKNYLRIVYRPTKVSSVIFYHKDNPYNMLSGLYEIIFYDVPTDHQLNILKVIGGDSIKLHVMDQNLDVLFLNFLINKQFPQSITINVQEMPLYLAHKIRRLNLRELTVYVNEIDFETLKLLLLTRCIYFEFSIQKLIDIPDIYMVIPIFSNCLKIHIHLENGTITEKYRLKRQKHEKPQVILKMTPSTSHEQYCFDLPDFMKPEFEGFTELVLCSLREKNLTRATIILNSFSRIQILDLELIDGEGLHLLSNNPQIRNLQVLELNISTSLNIRPKKIIDSLFLLKYLRVLHLSCHFLPPLEKRTLDDSGEVIFENLVEFGLNTNEFGLELLNLCRFSARALKIELRGYSEFPMDFILRHKNITELILETITCNDDWNTLLSCLNMRELTILQPMNFCIVQNTPNMNLQILSIKYFSNPITNTVLNLPNLRVFKIELIKSPSHEDFNTINMRIKHFLDQNMISKMDQTLQKFEIIDNVGLDLCIFIPLRFENLMRFHYINDRLDLKDFGFYVQYHFRHTLSRVNFTIFVKSKSIQAGFAWRIRQRQGYE